MACIETLEKSILGCGSWSVVVSASITALPLKPKRTKDYLQTTNHRYKYFHTHLVQARKL